MANFTRTVPLAESVTGLTRSSFSRGRAVSGGKFLEALEAGGLKPGFGPGDFEFGLQGENLGSVTVTPDMLSVGVSSSVPPEPSSRIFPTALDRQRQRIAGAFVRR